MMDPELKEGWCKDLESGNFAQCFTMMHDRRDDSYCCLGVLAKRAHLPVDQIAEYAADYDVTHYRSLVPLGLSSEVQYQLMNMNDDFGRSFKEIAAWLRANPEV